MRFYYPSVISLMLLGVFYALALIGLWLWWTKGLKREFNGPAAWSAMALVLVAPWAEELWIAWNFGQLCRKDAGIFINKVVEVEGYYDASAGLQQINTPVLPVTAENFERRGFKYYEMSLANRKGGPSKVAHFEKLNGEWSGTILDKPMARYQFGFNGYGKKVAYKVTKFESQVTDVVSGEVIGRHVDYGREAYWFFIHLGKPTMPCDETKVATLKHGTSLIYKLTLRPIKHDR